MSLETTQLLSALHELQARLRKAVALFGETGYRCCWHEELSPPGWHLAHCVHVEAHWIREAGLTRYTGARPGIDWMPWSLPKQERGAMLPPLRSLLRECTARQARHRRLLGRLPAQHRHALLQDHYLARFLIQHHAMHLESLTLAQAQRALRDASPNAAVAPAPRAGPRCPAAHHSLSLPTGRYSIGTANARGAFDNECRAHEVYLAGCRVARRPLSCAEYLAFMEEEGYRRPEYWSREGWEWRCRNACEAPGYWRRDVAGRWRWPDDKLHRAARRPVWGISYYEASACAAWGGGRLPHEYEWEAARRLGLLEGCGQTWEWCANPLHPYPGFKAYPYEEYSTPWFDGRHYILRGGSRLSGNWLQRPSFRNFHPPGHRHLNAGLRLVYDAPMRKHH